MTNSCPPLVRRQTAALVMLAALSGPTGLASAADMYTFTPQAGRADATPVTPPAPDFVLASTSASSATQRSSDMLLAEASEADSAARRERLLAPTGTYFRVTGAWNELKNDARFRISGASIGTDDGFGGSFAVGYRDLTRPIAFEVEYAFRQLETDDFIDPRVNLLADTRLNLHSISGNVLFDAANVAGPVGIYAGAGLGFRISEVRISVGSGGSSSSVSGDGLVVQAMAGLTLSLGQAAQLHAGVRWSDAGTIDSELLRFDTETVAFEVGLRVFF